MTGRAFVCQYAGTAKGRRYEMWREEFARQWLSIDFIPVDDDCIAAEIQCSRHGVLDLCTMRGMPMHMDRTPELARQTRGYRYLILASGTPMQASQRGRTIELAPGQMTLMSGDEPARLTQVSSGHRWSIRLQHRWLADFCRDVDDRIVRPLEINPELANLVSHQIETAHRFGPRLDAAANQSIGQHLLDLVGLCLGGDGDAAHVAHRRGLAAARLDAIKSDVLRDIGRPDLGLADIAAKHGLNTRYVQYLFERAGTSFTAFVLEQRLLLAHRLLREPRSGLRKISDIASGAGFSDISYFNRAFRTRFAATPSDVRAVARSMGSPPRAD
jgi:AraC-like DNA-binding protein